MENLARWLRSCRLVVSTLASFQMCRQGKTMVLIPMCWASHGQSAHFSHSVPCTTVDILR